MILIYSRPIDTARLSDKIRSKQLRVRTSSSMQKFSKDAVCPTDTHSAAQSMTECNCQSGFDGQSIGKSVASCRRNVDKSHRLLRSGMLPVVTSVNGSISVTAATV